MKSKARARSSVGVLDTKRRVLIATAIGALVAGGAYVWSTRATKVDASSAALGESGPFAEGAWPKGSRTSYHLAWKTNARATIEGPHKDKTDDTKADSKNLRGLETAFDVEGDLDVESHGLQKDGLALGLRWAKLDRAKADALGKPVAGPGELETQLRDAAMVVVLEPGGHVKEIGFSDGASPLARLVSRAIALDFTAEIAAASGKVDVVDTAIGRARLTRDPNDARKTSRSYEELDAFPNGFGSATKVDAKGEVSTSTGGVVERIASNEVVAATGDQAVSGFDTSTSLTAKLLGRTKTDAPFPAYAKASIRPRIEDAGYDRHASLERRSLGVTPETMHADVRAAALFPRLVTTEWVWRDSAYLELHPEEAGPLLDRAAPLGTPALAAAFDIVVIAGTDEGQAALVRALASPAAESEEAYITLVQRTAFLWSPTPEIVAVVGRDRARFRGTDRGQAATYTLGSLAHAVAREAPEVASQIVRDLEGDLAAAKNSAERVALLAALGNAGLAQSDGAITAHARDMDPLVRASVAHALRKIPTDDAVATLEELISDPEPDVAGNALDSLLRRELDDEDWSLLSRRVTDGAVRTEAFASLVNGLNRRRGDDPRAEGVLVAMATSPIVPPDVKQRIENMLAQ